MARKQNLSDVCYLTQDFHVWPDFHGNRSPVADSTIRGMVNLWQFTIKIRFSFFQKSIIELYDLSSFMELFLILFQICGLSLDVTEENLAVLYLSTMQALTVK